MDNKDFLEIQDINLKGKIQAAMAQYEKSKSDKEK